MYFVSLAVSIYSVYQFQWQLLHSVQLWRAYQVYKLTKGLRLLEIFEVQTPSEQKKARVGVSGQAPNLEKSAAGQTSIDVHNITKPPNQNVAYLLLTNEHSMDTVN